MNKKLLALAIGAAAVMPLVAQADGPTLYGKMNVTLDQIENDTGVSATTTKAWKLNSNASRLGIKGDAETGVANLKGIYQAEYEINVDGADAGVAATVFKQRDIFAGLKGDFGTLRAGNFDTPLKASQGKVDQFNDLAGDIKAIMPGEVRASNVVAYSSPKLGEMFTVNVALIPGEGVDIDNGDGDALPTTDAEEGLMDAMSASVVLESGAFYAALAMDKNISGSGNVDGFTDIDSVTAGTQSASDTTRLVGAYKADSFEIGAIYQTADDVSNASVKSDKAMFLSGAFISGDWKIKAQFGNGEGDAGKKKTLSALGADYKLGKSTMLFAYYADVSTDNIGAAVDTSVTTLALGLEQKF